MINLSGEEDSKPDQAYQPLGQNFQDPVEKFREHMAQYGLFPKGPLLLNGDAQRFGKDKVSWYAGFRVGDFVAGSCASWDWAEPKKTFCSKKAGEMTPEEDARIQKRIKDFDEALVAANAKRHALARDLAIKCCTEAPPQVGDDHPYLKAKGVDSHGLRISKQGNLLVPMVNETGLLWNFETIPRDGGVKKGLTGGMRIGLFHEIQAKYGNNQTVLCEGYSTGATIHEKTGARVLCCFNAGNMPHVAKLMGTLAPWGTITIAADNDQWPNSLGKITHAGLTKAKEAAAIIGARAYLVCPTFTNDSIIKWREQTGDLIKGPTDFNDLAALAGGQAVRDQLAVFSGHVNVSPRKFKLVRLSDIQFKAPDWLIKNLIEKDSLNLLFGDPASGKTFAAIDMVCCVASGKDFNGMPVKQGPVVYIAGEGQNGLKRRFMAWGIKNDINIDEHPIFLSLIPAALSEADQVLAIRKAIKDVADEYGPPVLIVFDTVARNFGPGDENSTKDMTAVVAGLDDIRMDYKPGVLLVHHTGHGDKGRARGAMALKGALDSEYRVEKDDTGTVRVENTKMKDHTKPDPMAFKLATIELGMEDEDGEEITSAVLNPVAYSEPGKDKKPGKTNKTPHQRAAMDALTDLYVKEANRLIKAGKSQSDALVYKSNLNTHLVKKLDMPSSTADRIIKSYLPTLEGVTDEGDYFKVIPV